MSAFLKQGTLMYGIATRISFAGGDVVIMASTHKQLQTVMDALYPGTKCKMEMSKRAIIVSAETLEGGVK